MADRIRVRAAHAFPAFLVAVVALLAVGTISNVLRLNATNAKLRTQAEAGQKARVTQCHTFPVAVKLYTAAERYGLLTAADLRTYLAAAPRGCPPVKP